MKYLTKSRLNFLIVIRSEFCQFDRKGIAKMNFLLTAILLSSMSIPMLVHLILPFGASASPLNMRHARHAMKDPESDYLWHWLDFGCRNMMREGIPPLQIPSLDPFTVDTQSFIWDMDKTHLEGTIYNSTCVGLTKFIIRHVNVDMKRGRLRLELHFPLIVLHGHYKVEGDMFGVKLHGDGPYQLLFHDCTLNSSSMFTMNEDNKLQIYRLKQEISFGSLSANFEGLMGGGDTGQAANNILNSNAMTIFHNLKTKFEEEYNEKLMSMFNKFIEKINSRDLLYIGRFSSAYDCCKKDSM